MSDGEARGTGQQTPRVPNNVLRKIRKDERGESQREFADAMARAAWEMGVEVYPDDGYVQRLESGSIKWPHRTYRTILEKLCGRPVGQLGFSPTVRAGSSEISSRGNVALREAIWGSGIEVIEFARKIEVNPKTVERWITRGVIPRPLHRWKSALIIGIDESELWSDAVIDREIQEHRHKRTPRRKPAAVSPSEISPSSSSDEASDLRGANYDLDEEVMKRRAFLVGTAAVAGLGQVDTPAAIETIRQELNISLAEERADADADEWQEIAKDYGESYLATAPADLIEPLMVDMLGMKVALRRSEGRDSAQRDLLRTAALLSAFTAQTMMNTGKMHEARRWWRTAKNSADRSGDPYSVLWVRAREINRADEYRPAAAILPLVEEAEKHIDRAPVDAVLEFLSAKAVTLARVGRPHHAENAINQIRELSDGLTAESGSLLVWDRAGQLHGVESFVYSRLGNLEKTRSASAAADELRDSSNLRHHASNAMKLGFCMVREGDITAGLSHARAVLGDLPREQRANYLISDAHELLTSVPASARRLNAANEYREWLSSL